MIIKNWVHIIYIFPSKAIRHNFRDIHVKLIKSLKETLNNEENPSGRIMI